MNDGGVLNLLFLLLYVSQKKVKKYQFIEPPHEKKV